jgi:hypothetical protein
VASTWAATSPGSAPSASSTRRPGGASPTAPRDELGQHGVADERMREPQAVVVHEPRPDQGGQGGVGARALQLGERRGAAHRRAVAEHRQGARDRQGVRRQAPQAADDGAGDGARDRVPGGLGLGRPRRRTPPPPASGRAP